ncbi:MAG: YggS family pyridoxal phosphate-dependent enzyme [Saprospiraceae bacterium]|nr:YggS family pyridoxal phosphate-dependent enzyme [Saprospiraceae bacterium]
MYKEIQKYCSDRNVSLVAVSKTKPIEDIQNLYDQGQRIFGENKVQEMEEKYYKLPKDISWHIIGHLQKNKVKYIASFVGMIHSVDSLELLQIIDKEAKKHNRIIPVLLQFHISKEDTKFGLQLSEAYGIMDDVSINPIENINIVGVMGMASFTDNINLIRSEFKLLKDIFTNLKNRYFSTQNSFSEISMGMSGDFKIAIEEGSTMVRVGSAIFGAR